MSGSDIVSCCVVYLFVGVRESGRGWSLILCSVLLIHKALVPLAKARSEHEAQMTQKSLPEHLVWLTIFDLDIESFSGVRMRRGSGGTVIFPEFDPEHTLSFESPARVCLDGYDQEIGACS